MRYTNRRLPYLYLYCYCHNNGKEQHRTVVILGEIGAEVEQEVDDLRRAQFQRTDDDRATNELGVTIVRVSDQVTLINCVYLLLTCPITHSTRMHS